MTIDEKALRRPGFDESTSQPVDFGAAGVFHLPKPRVRARRFVFGDDGRAASTMVATDDPEFDALLLAVEKEDTFLAMGNMAAYLLRKNYDVGPDQLSAILEYDPEDESPGRWPLAVMAVIYGRTGGNG